MGLARAQEGQTAAPDANEKVDLHFICFVEKDGVLYELDGRKDAPVAHGASSADRVLQDACRVVQERFIALDPAEVRFTMIALTGAAPS